jgi:F-type H+-transporting ATPase subunit delta
MQNPRLAGRYAKSLIDIAVEQNKLDVMYEDMKGLQQVCDTSSEFVQLMKSPIVKGTQKKSIIKAILSGKVDGVTEAFINLIIIKGREFFLPEIISSFISQYKERNNITDVLLTTSEPLDEALHAALSAKIASQLNGKKVDLKTKVNPALIGGFILEANNNLFDASILRDLNDIKKQFLQNLYIPDIR